MKKFSKQSSQLKRDFDSILNDIWCTYSFQKGYKKWREIRSTVEQPYRNQIEIELGHVDLGHGIDQARLAVKDEMQKYMDYLLEEN